jgi:hypothetical protein
MLISATLRPVISTAQIATRSGGHTSGSMGNIAGRAFGKIISIWNLLVVAAVVVCEKRDGSSPTQG